MKNARVKQNEGQMIPEQNKSRRIGWIRRRTDAVCCLEPLK